MIDRQFSFVWRNITALWCIQNVDEVLGLKRSASPQHFGRWCSLRMYKNTESEESERPRTENENETFEQKVPDSEEPKLKIDELTRSV